MNPYAGKVPLQVWWTLGLSIAIVVLLFALPPAIEVVDRFKELCATLGAAG